MKRLSAILPTVIVLCVLLFVVYRFQNTQSSIAVLDYKKIIAESSAVKIAGEYFAGLQENYRVDIDAIKDKKQQEKILEEKQGEFTQRIEILDTYLNTTLEGIINTYRKDNGITAIFPQESVLSVAEKADITANIIAKFNELVLDSAKIQEIITKALADKQTNKPATTTQQ